MRGLIVIVGLAIAVAACDRPQPVALDAPPPYATSYQYPPPAQYPPPSPQYGAQYPPPAPVMVQAPASQPMCTEADAAQILSTNRTLAGSNDPCVVYWRSMHVREHPERSFELECNGLKAYPDPQPPGHPVSIAECDSKYRDDQARMGIPIRGMTDEQKSVYRLTWGN